MQTKEKTILLVFAIAAIGNLASTLLDASLLNYATKPLLLLPLLVAWQSVTLLKPALIGSLQGPSFFPGLEICF